MVIYRTYGDDVGKAVDSNQALEGLLFGTDAVAQEDNNENDMEELKKNYLTGAGINAAFPNNGNRESFFGTEYDGNSPITPSSFAGFIISPTLWGIGKRMDYTSGAFDKEKEEKAKENAEINSNLYGDVELSNIENTLGGGTVSGLTTEQTMLDREAINNKVNGEEKGWTDDLKTWWKSIPANRGIDSKRTQGATPMVESLFDYTSDKSTYDTKLQTAIMAKKALDSGQITQKDYDEYYNDLKTYVETTLGNKKLFSATAESFGGVDGMINDLIKTGTDISDLEGELDEIDPSRLYGREGSQIRIADGTKKIMESVTDSLRQTKNSTYDKQIYNALYSVGANRLSRYNNSINYVGTIMRDIVARAGGDPTKIEGKDKEIYADCMRALTVYDKFVDNLTKLLSYVPKLKDPDTGRLVLPDIIDGKSVHDWLFDGLDDILYKDSDFGYITSDHKNVSDIDVLENMTQSISFDYNYAHPLDNWYKTIFPWTAAQYTVGTVVGGQLTEWEQEILGRLGTFAYNTVASEASEINYSYLNQDFTDFITVNTHDSTTARTIQKRAANTFEYLPEIGGAFLETMAGGGLGKAAKATNVMKVLRTEGVRRLLSQSMRYAGNRNTTKVPGIWNNFKNTLKNIPRVADDIVKNGGVDVIKGGKVVRESLDGVTDLQRLSNNLIYDLGLIEGGMDAYFDSRFADADLEQGSDISFLWSLGGTLAGTYLPWLYRTGLFRDTNLIEKEIINSLSGGKKVGEVEAAIKNWGEGGAYNLMKLSESSKYNPLDAMAKAQYGLNSSKLASLEQIESMGGMMNDVIDAFTDVYRSLNPSAKKMTDDAVKHMMGLYMEQIFGADSQMARRIWNLVADKRTNPADIYKYTLRLRGTAGIGPWRSSISLIDNAKNKFVNYYNEDLDLLPSFQQGGFSRGLSEGFTSKELKELRDAGYSWAAEENFKTNKDGRYLFTSDGIEKASKDIDTMSMDVQRASKVTDSSESFDKLMRNNNLKKISDETLTAITQSGAYDNVSNALGSLDWLCNLKNVG